LPHALGGQPCVTELSCVSYVSFVSRRRVFAYYIHAYMDMEARAGTLDGRTVHGK